MTNHAHDVEVGAQFLRHLYSSRGVAGGGATAKPEGRGGVESLDGEVDTADDLLVAGLTGDGANANANDVVSALG